MQVLLNNKKYFMKCYSILGSLYSNDIYLIFVLDKMLELELLIKNFFSWLLFNS